MDIKQISYALSFMSSLRFHIAVTDLKSDKNNE